MATQNTEFFIRAKLIFDKAITLSKEEREQYITHICGNDTALLRYCEKLLLNVSGDQTFAEEFLSSDLPDNPPGSLAGESIGHYRLDRLAGTGGMADVYIATRTDGVHDTQVAVKLVRGWGDASDLVSRFKQERRILARLKHPNIAQFLDGGLSRDGRPYFVMEYVEGACISEYCKLHRLGLDERLHLFLKVCNAVAHAHQQLIIHRDIKPGNVLVTNSSEVKLLDFGIAKILDDDQEEGSHHTIAGLPLTPQYSCPEQVLKQPLSTASDQFSLGVLLYELLTECLPYKITKESNNFDILRQVCEAQPEKPARRANANIALAVNNRRRFLNRLSGDIESIIAKALDKRPDKRYDSVQHFAEDIQRFLDNKPVRARNASWLYVTSKHARRHWKAIAVASCLIAVFSFQQIRLMQQQQSLIEQQENLIAERNLAQQKSLESLQIQNFLTGLFKFANPRTANGQDITVKTLLREGVEKIDTELNEQPRIKANLLHTMGSVHIELGLYDDATSLLRNALDYYESQTDSSDEDIAAALYSMGELERRKGNFTVALDYLNRSQILFSGQSPTHIALADVFNTKGAIYCRNQEYATAINLIEEARSILTINDSKDRIDESGINTNMGACYAEMGEYTKAGEYFEAALRYTSAKYGDNSIRNIATLSNLAGIQSFLGDMDSALRLLTRARNIAENNPLNASYNLSVIDLDISLILMEMERNEEAHLFITRAIAGLEEWLPPNHMNTAVAYSYLAQILLNLDNIDQSLVTIDKSIPMLTSSFPPSSPYIADAYALKAEVLAAKKEYQAALDLFQQAYTIQVDALGPDHQISLDMASRLREITALLAAN